MSYALGAIKSPNDDRDWTVESIFYAFNGNQDIEETKLPRKYDMSPEMPPIRNQGSQGACSAFAASAIKEHHEAKDINFSDHMAPQFIYNLRSNYPRYGMYGRDTMKILQIHGVPPEESYKYLESKEHYISDDIKVEASNFKIGSYATINTINGLKESLIRSGPAWIAFPVYNVSGQMWKKGGNEKLQGYHAMCVCCYDEKGFKIRNSWGDRWNSNGYTTFYYHDFGLQIEIWTDVATDSTPLKKKKKKNKCLPF